MPEWLMGDLAKRYIRVKAIQVMGSARQGSIPCLVAPITAICQSLVMIYVSYIIIDTTSNLLSLSKLVPYI